MKLLQLDLVDYRCFGKASLDFRDPGTKEPSNLIVLVGPNGSGKSSVLQAIAGSIGALAGSYGADPLLLSDVRDGAAFAKVGVTWIDGPLGPGAGSRGVIFNELAMVRVGCQADGRALAPGVQRLPGPDSALGAWLHLVMRETVTQVGLILYFDVFRILPHSSVAGPNLTLVVKDRIHGALAPTVGRQGGLHPRYAQLRQWIVNLDYQRVKEKADRSCDLPAWDHLTQTLDTLFAPYRFDRVDERFDVLFQTPTGRVPLGAISDGYRSLFVIATELLLRLSLCTATPSEMLTQEAVCLVDEIDVHLHPTLQGRIIPALRTLFPNVQFIVTTHSPLVVASVEPHQVFRLEGVE